MKYVITEEKWNTAVSWLDKHEGSLSMSVHNIRTILLYKNAYETIAMRD